MDNAEIADRLDAFAAVLELGDANPYTTRAYRRAAETVRHSGVPVAELVAAGRGRELRGIGPGIEARLRELVATGQIAELAELERDLVPDLVGLGRYLGLSAQRVIGADRLGAGPGDRGPLATGAVADPRLRARRRRRARPRCGARRRRAALV